MINSGILKSFITDENITNIIKNITQEQTCDQDIITLTIEQNDGNEGIEKQLIINSELDMDAAGYYKSKLNGYDVSEAPRKTTVLSEKVEYPMEVNSFVENSGLTIQNIDLLNLEGDYIKLADFGKDFLCGNILENIVFPFEKDESSLLIIDFKKIESLSEKFLETFTKYLLKTSNKVIPINMNAQIANEFYSFISIYLVDPELLIEEDEGE